MGPYMPAAVPSDMPQDIPELDPRRRRLLFRARHRGTKEADLMIGGFVSRNLSAFSEAELGEIEAVTLHGRPAHRTPTALFSVRGHTPQAVYELLAERGVNAPGGSFYALEAAEWLGLGEAGANRAGLAPYTDQHDVDRLVEGVAALV